MELFKISYRFADDKDKIEWTAAIVSDSAKQAMVFLDNALNRPYIIQGTEMVGAVHAISDEIIHRILGIYGVGQHTQVKAEEQDRKVTPLVLPKPKMEKKEKKSIKKKGKLTRV